MQSGISPEHTAMCSECPKFSSPHPWQTEKEGEHKKSDTSLQCLLQHYLQLIKHGNADSRLKSYGTFNPMEYNIATKNMFYHSQQNGMNLGELCEMKCQEGKTSIGQFYLCVQYKDVNWWTDKAK